ncbi:MAG: HAD family phosphatase [Ruminococcus flavefaciens]|nr:HAD family phosphatase [Ruminococcus flavefaciens]MCM1362664.1 HAD family phosphatase [Clostridiales bacterium]MCM1435057.1 HAD family phosphatase [Ruminococcus flavefaciens]
MIKGVIFDLDGTLIDSMQIWTKIDRKLLIENGVENIPPDISDRVRKMTIEESAQYFIDEFGFECTSEYIIKRIEELVRIEYEENIPLKSYAAEFLDYLDEKKIPYGVATATYKGLAEAVLKRCGIWERMRFLLTEVEYPLGKKFPNIFLGAAERLGLKPEEVLVVEDSLHCIETAAKAGFITAGVYDEVSWNEQSLITDTADYYVRSLKELEILFK